jgi:hypothetical protein
MNKTHTKQQQALASNKGKQNQGSVAEVEEVGLEEIGNRK